MSEPNSPSIVVRHHAAKCRFEAVVDRQIAVVEYQLDGDRMIFTHTFVPVELRGRGIAEKLVRPAQAVARAERRRVVPACSYVAAFIEQNVEFQDLLA